MNLFKPFTLSSKKFRHKTDTFLNEKIDFGFHCLNVCALMLSLSELQQDINLLKSNIFSTNFLPTPQTVSMFLLAKLWKPTCVDLYVRVWSIGWIVFHFGFFARLACDCRREFRFHFLSRRFAKLIYSPEITKPSPGREITTRASLFSKVFSRPLKLKLKNNSCDGRSALEVKDDQQGGADRKGKTSVFKHEYWTTLFTSCRAREWSERA